MHPKKEKKQQLKEMTKKIRLMKSKRKELEGQNNYEIWKASREYRHEHIAYCLVRGRKYEEIENKTGEFNKPNWYIINKLKDTLQNKINEFEEFEKLQALRLEAVNE